MNKVMLSLVLIAMAAPSTAPAQSDPPLPPEKLAANSVIKAKADQLVGRVVGVADGDTITVLDATQAQHRIRLMGIDAPEKKQPFGAAAKQHLASQVYDKSVMVEYAKRDRYGRIIGKVMLDGRDVCLEQIKAGLAWHYKKYAAEQAMEDRDRYAAAEDSARNQRVGLWADPAPVAPWEYRHPSLQKSGGRQ